LTRTPDDQRKGQSQGLSGADAIPEHLKRATVFDELKARDADIHLKVVREHGKAYLEVDWNVTSSTGKRVIKRNIAYTTIKGFMDALEYRLEV